ncbi:MAG: tetratricopeptide repeat protein [Anaerolineales bacterium]|nr:tetratricopeptide repeat protein [Anaerolineales bacterium]
MYLKGSKWSMNRRRKRPNWFRITILVLLIAAGIYLDRVIIPAVPQPFVPTATPTRAPESYVVEAEALFNEGKLLQSIDTYTDAIQQRPDDPTLFISRARVQIYAGQYADAQTSAEDALLLNPNNSMAHVMRAWALDFQGDYLAAESAIRRALELDPDNALAHAVNVEILIDSYFLGTGTFEGLELAVEESRVAQNLAPNSLETHRARGLILEATGNYEEAIREFEAAIAINPNIAVLHLSLGTNYRVLNIYDKAVEEFTRANALNPSDPTPDLYISRTYATVGEYAKATQYAETAVTDNPTDANLRGNLGVMYYRNLEWPKAIEQLKIVVAGGATEDNQPIEPIPLANDTRIAEYYFTYGLVLARLNRCGEALQIAQQIQARIPTDEIAVANAQEMINICQQNLAATPTPELLPLPTETSLPEVLTVTPAP